MGRPKRTCQEPKLADGRPIVERPLDRGRIALVRLGGVVHVFGPVAERDCCERMFAAIWHPSEPRYQASGWRASPSQAPALRPARRSSPRTSTKFQTKGRDLF